jgi:hypothetical protein
MVFRPGRDSNLGLPDSTTVILFVLTISSIYTVKIRADICAKNYACKTIYLKKFILKLSS